MKQELHTGGPTCHINSLDLSKIGTLTSIDMPFLGHTDEDKIGCVIPKRFFKYWKLIRLPDRDAVPKVVKKCKF